MPPVQLFCTFQRQLFSTHICQCSPLLYSLTHHIASWLLLGRHFFCAKISKTHLDSSSNAFPSPPNIPPPKPPFPTHKNFTISLQRSPYPDQCFDGFGPFFPPAGGGGLPYRRDGGARQKFRILPLKETNLGIAKAYEDP